MMFDCRRTLITFRVVLAAMLLALAGCSTTGSSFSASSLDLIQPGQTTLAQASALLKADPVNVYHQGDGSLMARWAHRATFVPDAIYMNRELWLAFDRNGYFERIVKSVNVPQSGQAGQTHQSLQTPGARPVSPLPAAPADSPVASPVQL